MKIPRNDPALKQRRQELRRNQTDAEKTLWRHVCNRQFFGPRFFRQYSIGPYILDFYCPAIKLAVELDGGQHLQSENREYDEARSKYLQDQGIHVIRFWNHDVSLDIQSVMNKLEEKITPPRLPLQQGAEQDSKMRIFEKSEVSVHKECKKDSS